MMIQVREKLLYVFLFCLMCKNCDGPDMTSQLSQVVFMPDYRVLIQSSAGTDTAFLHCKKVRRMSQKHILVF